MSARERFYEETILPEINENLPDKKNRLSNRLASFVIKKMYKANAIAIDYKQKIVYLQYLYSVHHTDERLQTAAYKIVEMPFQDTYRMVRKCLRIQNKQLISFSRS